MSDWQIEGVPETAEEFQGLLDELRSSPGAQAFMAENDARAAAAEQAQADARLAAMRFGVGEDVAAAADRLGAKVGDGARAASVAEAIFAGALENRAAAHGAITPATVKETEKFAVEQAAKIATGKQTYGDISRRYSELHGDLPVAREAARNLDPHITPRH